MVSLSKKVSTVSLSDFSSPITSACRKSACVRSIKFSRLIGAAQSNRTVPNIKRGSPPFGGRNGKFGICAMRSAEHTSELQQLMRNSYPVFCLKKKKINEQDITNSNNTN